MSDTYWIVNTITGVKQVPVVPAAGDSWSRVLNGTGSGSTEFVFPVPAPGDPVIDYEALFTPWASTLVVENNWGAAFGVTPSIDYAGIIISEDYDVDTNRSTLEHADLRAILALRYTFGLNGYSGNIDDNKLEMLNRTLAWMAPLIVWSGTEAVGGNYSLPICVPEGRITYSLLISLPFAGTDSRTIYDYNLTDIESALQELQDAGPDVDFAPRWSAGGALEWLQRVGTGANGDLAGNVYEFNMTVRQPGVFGVSRKRDGSKQATRSYGVGAGSEMGMLVKTASVASTLPSLERVTSTLKTTDDGAALQKHADADVALFSKATHQWTLSMRPGTARGMPLGSRVSLYFRGNVRIPDGWHHLRVIGISKSGPNSRRIAVQPIGGA
jgi:hypothetical protein